ncbi:MAG: TatD family hydrolase [Vulcanimicrobiaceae bacterium]
MIDSHAHVHDKAFDDDRAEVVARARATGITAMISIGCDIADSKRALACAQEFGLYASVGVHPHEAEDAPEDLAAAFAPFFEDRRIVAVGETGLDYYYDHSPRDVQRAVLRAQLRIARDRNLPVIFHHRDAFDDFVAILREEFTPGMRGVIHCFTGDSAQALAYVEEFGLKLGIGGILTFKTAGPIRDAVLAVGLERLILETDCPYLAPIPYRGKRNEPAYIGATAAKLAEILERPVDEVAATTSANARELFGLPL